MPHRTTSGFTLLELSIVLVIIGLVAGGVLLGRDLIAAATIRSTISQIEKYKTAVNTFRTKYNYLPGDIPADQAAQTGLAERDGEYADGNGDGLVVGLSQYPFATLQEQIWYSYLTRVYAGGETVLFWTDLSSAGVINDSFTATDDPVLNCTPTNMPCNWSRYFPVPKTGHNGFIVAFHSGMARISPTAPAPFSGLLFEIASIPESLGNMNAAPALTVNEAYSIDSKIDDGQRDGGNVRTAAPGKAGNGGGTYLGTWDPNGGASTDQFCLSNGTYNLKYPDSLSCSLIFNTSI